MKELSVGTMVQQKRIEDLEAQAARVRVRLEDQAQLKVNAE